MDLHGSGIAFLFCSCSVFVLFSCHRVFVFSCFRVFLKVDVSMAEVASKAAGKNTKREENRIMQHKFK